MGEETTTELLENVDSDKVAIPLINSISSYDTRCDNTLIKRAVEFAICHHGSQKRLSGDPYYHHPVAVAEILTGMKLDSRTIITALLHDTIEDTDVTKDMIAEEFGDEIAHLVEGVTKLTKIEYKSYDQQQADNFRKLLIAISEDIRVLLVKLADRLHNMRTLHHIPKEKKRKRIARETMDIYAPLAERIGMRNVKDELEAIAFNELYPDACQSIQHRLEQLRTHDKQRVERTLKHLKTLLKESGIKATLSGREKAPYSIWRKMQKRNMTFEMLSDITAFRIIVPSDEDCYRALGVIHATYHALPGQFKDYISTPKNNGYQSLHTIVMGPEQQRVEIQIRTEEMHEISEMGVAAHWSYKQGQPYTTESREYRWIRELLHIIENSSEPEEVMEHTKLEMYHDQVFCFTPKGDLIALPKGATPVDFAFSVHSEVGQSCVGAKINNRIMPLRTQLKNGDQVEILQSKSQIPSPSWENFVVTGKARSEIRKTIRTNQRNEYIKLGRSMLTKAFLSIGEELDDNLLEPLIDHYQKTSVKDIYASLGEGTIQRSDVLNHVFPDKSRSSRTPSLLSRLRRISRKSSDDGNFSVPIMGLTPGMAIHFASCCHPLPGEKIAGIVNSGKGITIHTADCIELEHFVDTPERWVDVRWETDTGEHVFVGQLVVVLYHQKGSLGELANTIAQGKGNINNIRIVHRSTDLFEIVVDIEVRDIEHFNEIIGLLRTNPKVHSVSRHKQGKEKES